MKYVNFLHLQQSAHEVKNREELEVQIRQTREKEMCNRALVSLFFMKERMSIPLKTIIVCR